MYITVINPLNAELNFICYLLALLAHHFLHVSRIKVNVKSLMKLEFFSTDFLKILKYEVL
jgi:hypothetical protein